MVVIGDEGQIEWEVKVPQAQQCNGDYDLGNEILGQQASIFCHELAREISVIRSEQMLHNPSRNQPR